MSDVWKTEKVKSEEQALSLLLELQAKRWLSRGHSQTYGNLKPSIDRDELARLSRGEKLNLERQSIDLLDQRCDSSRALVSKTLSSMTSSR